MRMAIACKAGAIEQSTDKGVDDLEKDNGQICDGGDNKPLVSCSYKANGSFVDAFKTHHLFSYLL